MSFLRLKVMERVKFMNVFNAFQAVLAFAAGPFLITLVNEATFFGHGVLFGVLLAGYACGFLALVAVVAESLE